MSNKTEVKGVDKSVKIPKLTRKQKAFADELLADKKISATEAIVRAYNVEDRNTASVMGVENLRKPSIIAYLDQHVQMAKSRVVELASQDEDKRLSFDASRDILDRTLGKATQKIETQNTSINLVISMK